MVSAASADLLLEIGLDLSPSMSLMRSALSVYGKEAGTSYGAAPTRPRSFTRMHSSAGSRVGDW